jgi:cysteine desulfurase/selenocysteine lyase
VNDRGELIFEEFEKLLNPKTRIVAVAHVSNSLGTVNPVKEIIRVAQQHGVPVLIDGAQGIQHMKVDVRELDCDFYVFSGHKTYGPTGIGVLYGKQTLLDSMPPYQGGGDMIKSVTFEKTTFNDLPYRFEAGTPNIAGAIGLGVAIDFMKSIGLDAIAEYEEDLLEVGRNALSEIRNLRLIGTARRRASVLSFVIDGVHPHDVGTIVDREGVAIRTGHHCAQPVMERFGVPATARASLAVYNTEEDIEALVRALHKVREVFG